ncbi:MAG: AraC family transcriptional regulator [Algibacter sp.]|uniref:helix-turn-helix domain-containing protein n=1 Tax=Algibacter sp. TaxID=1872428 RepID=UPI002633A36C|nr:AraC family transcriptional regulator [Algibacter sp.]MDG1729690.1 AraC family transcriptional regulator [Algibacter sp.]MDG2178961.1 AraC family transcriptional regulator [Algibacter sp.]
MEKLYIKNMMSKCCTTIIRNLLESNNIKVLFINLGYAEVIFLDNSPSFKELDKILRKLGFGLVVSREKRIVEQTKIAVIELIHLMNNVNSIVQKTDYLVEKLNLSYQQLSKLFSKYENTTLEKFIIQNKIERIKELIDSDEFTLSEIAYMMDYSSVQYLSSQFKKETGITVSEYKKDPRRVRIALEDLL